MSRGRHRSGRRRRPEGWRRFLPLARPRPPGRRRRSSSPIPQPPRPGRELAALEQLAGQLDQLRLDVAVLGGRLDAVAARIERLAAVPPSAPVVLPVPPRGPTVRLPLLRAALAEPVGDAPIGEEQASQMVQQRRVGDPVREPDVA